MALKALSFEGLTYYHNKIKTLLSGKVDKEDGKGLSSNDYTTAEKQKLAGIETGADANVIETVQVNGSALSVTDKKVNVDLSAYALKSDISAVYRFKGNVATYADLPNTNQTVGDVYNVEEDGGNYAWTGETWDDLAGVVDLTEYYTKEEADGKYVGLTGDQTIEGLKTFSNKMNVNNTLTAYRINRKSTYLTRAETPETTTWVDMSYLDKNDDTVAMDRINYSTDGTISRILELYGHDGSAYTMRPIVISSDGSVYATAPTPSSASDNSIKIATTAWVNLADSVVHTTGNETIAGTKTFTGMPVITGSNYRRIQFLNTGITAGDGKVGDYGGIELQDSSGARRAMLRGTKDANDINSARIVAYNTVDGTEVSTAISVYATAAGEFYAQAPATRETGYGSTDIATCGWVETKIATGGGEAITNDEIDSIFA